MPSQSSSGMLSRVFCPSPNQFRVAHVVVSIVAMVVIVELGVSAQRTRLDASETAPSVGQIAGAPDVAKGEASESQDEAVALRGLWSRYEGTHVGDPVRFYYFHGDGHGLYRYGRQGRTNTNSFDYVVDGNQLALTFRKTGAHHETKLTLEKDLHGQTWLRMADDPREPGARYRRLPPPGNLDRDAFVGLSGNTPSDSADAMQGAAPAIAGRIWIDYRNFQTGGAGFRMYQFNAAGIDGRGIGWYHEGDFNDWTTEALTYQLGPQSIRFWFLQRGEEDSSGMIVGRDDKQHPTLTLQTDPRDFWHAHTYVDGGASFGLAPFAHVLGHADMHPTANVEHDVATGR